MSNVNISGKPDGNQVLPEHSEAKQLISMNGFQYEIAAKPQNIPN